MVIERNVAESDVEPIQTGSGPINMQPCEATNHV